MKIIRNTYLLIALLGATSTQNTFSMQTLAAFIAKTGINGLSSLAELYIASLPLQQARRFKIFYDKEQLLETQSNTPEVITNFISHMATERGIENVKVINDDNFGEHYTISCDSTRKFICLKTEQVTELESLLSTNRSLEDEKALNKYIGDIQHELTHIQRNSRTSIKENVIGFTGSVATSAILSSIIGKQAPFIQKNLAFNNAFKITRGISTLLLAGMIVNLNLYSKYEELKADDGIPNQKHLLEIQAEDHKKYHEGLLDVIEDIQSSSYTELINRSEQHRAMLNTPQVFAMKILPKKWFDIPLITNAICYPRAEHPCSRQRELRFLNRIAAIDRAATTNSQ